VPASRDGLGPFYQDVIAVDPLEPWDAASAAYRLEMLARTLPFPVSGARLVPSHNNDVWRLEAGYLRVAWRGDRSRLAREAELLGRLRGFLPVPEVLDCGGDDRLSWSLTAAMPGTAYEQRCVQPGPPGLRNLAREGAGPHPAGVVLHGDRIGEEQVGVRVAPGRHRAARRPGDEPRADPARRLPGQAARNSGRPSSAAGFDLSSYHPDLRAFPPPPVGRGDPGGGRDRAVRSAVLPRTGRPAGMEVMP
jgi:hypothetical protein